MVTWNRWLRLEGLNRYVTIWRRAMGGRKARRLAVGLGLVLALILVSYYRALLPDRSAGRPDAESLDNLPAETTETDVVPVEMSAGNEDSEGDTEGNSSDNSSGNAGQAGSGTVEAPGQSPEAEPEPELPAAETRFTWPVTGEILVPFGFAYSRTYDDYRYHSGIDIKAAEGALIRAALSGRVVVIEDHNDLGKRAVIEHDNGLVSVYANAAIFSVQEGQLIRQGEVIGRVGSTALAESADPPHLHFEIREGGQEVDPARYLER